MDAESTLAEKIVPPNNGSGETTDPAVLKEKAAEELKSAASLKGGGEETTKAPEAVPIEKDDLLERLEKIDTSSPTTTTTNATTKATDGGTSTATNDVDMENDDLIQRLEAIEKGEAEESTPAGDSSKKEEDKKEEDLSPAEATHQNGLEKADEAELLEEKMEVDGVAADNKEDSTAAEKTTNGSSSAADHDTQAASSAKRRHSEDEELEPSSKKVHVEDNSKKPETVAEEKKEEPVEEEAKPESTSEKKTESEPAVEEKPKQEDQPAVKTDEEPKTVEEPPKEEEKVPGKDADVGCAKESSAESKDAVVETAKEPTAESKDEKTANEEKPLEESAPPPEPDPVEETDSNAEAPAVETPALEAASEEKKEKKPEHDAASVPEKKNEAVPEPAVEEKKPEEPKEVAKPVEEEAKAEVVADFAEKENVVVEATDKSEEKTEEVREPVEEAKQEAAASTDKVEPVAEAEKEDKSAEVATQEKAEALPDTEPNTESTSQQEEQPTSSSPAEVKETCDDAAISSSSEPQETAEGNSAEAETVTSSDEKPVAESEKVADSTPEAAAPAPTPVEPQADEAMEVDAAEPVVEKSEVAEVSETPCAKKEAYQCTEKVEDKKEETPEVAPVAEPEKAPAEDEQMEVDSAAVAPSQSKSDGDVTESMNTSSEELIKVLAKEGDEKEENVVDSASETNTTATVSALDKNVDAEEVPPAAEESKVLDDSIECSLPTSSSDKMADRLKQRLDLISNGSSTPNAAVSSSNVYNSTPIQKQFEISSENVSKITRPSADNSHQEEEEEHSAIVADNSTTVDEKEAVASTSASAAAREQEPKKEAPETSKESAATSLKEESSLKSSESSEVDSCTASSALNTAEETNLYANNARKFNGISSTSGSELEDKSAVQTPTNVTTTAASTTTTTTAANKLDLAQALTSEEALYEVSVWFDGVELQFLSVEKVVEHKLTGGAAAGSTQDLTGIDSSKQSSNGSVGSLGPFALPSARPAVDSHSSATDSSGTISSQSKAPLSKVKHTVRGAKALASLMIEEFTKIKRALNKDDELSDAELDQSSSNLKTPKTTSKKGGRGQKRTRTESEADEEAKSKQTPSKSVKKQKPDTPVPAEPEPPVNQDDWLCCMARWSDRKYYAGKVTGYKGDNKYMVLFEDGASKALSKDVIVIGDKDTLPIMGHAVHALTGGDTYEAGFVDEVKRNETTNEVSYVVRIGEGTVEVTASDMYLNEEQAKYINKACKAATEGAADDPMQSPSASGKRGSATNTPILQTPDEPSVTGGEKGSRSTRSKRGGDKPQTPVTPEAGYSGGVSKKGRRGRSKAQQSSASAPSAGPVSISESSDVSDTLEEDTPAPPSPDSPDLESVDGVQPELQRTQKESEIQKMYLIEKYLENGNGHTLDDVLGPLPGSKTVFRNKHFILTCTIPPKGICSTPDKNDMRNKYRTFSTVPFVKEHLRLQIEMGGGKLYEHFEDIPKAKYKQCKLIAPHPSATAKYVQCLAVDIPAVSHEWIIECCRTLTFLDFKPYSLPAGWSFLEERYIRWNCGRGVELRSTVNPFVGYCINIASLNKDFTEFWSRVCKMAGGTVRLIKCENDLTPNLSGYMLTDQEFPEDVKLRATRYGLQIVSTVWVVQSLIVGRVCQPDSHEKLTQIYQDDDY